MGKCRVFMRLTPAEAAAVRAFIRKPPSGPARLRAQAIWFSSQGHPVKEIAKLLSVAERSVWNWFDAWRRQGLQRPSRQADPPDPDRGQPQPPTAGPTGRHHPAIACERRDVRIHVELLVAVEMAPEDLSYHPQRRVGASDPAPARLAFPPPEARLDQSPDPDYAQKKRRLTG